MQIFSDINLYMSAFLLIVLWFYLKQVHRLLKGQAPLEMKPAEPKAKIQNAST